MRSGDLARVGLTVLIGLGLFIGAVFWLRNLSQDTYRYPVRFENAQGIQKGAYVRIGGVTMGQVGAVDLTPGAEKPALLTLEISRKYQVQPSDAIRIVAGLAGFSPPYVEITPGGLGADASHQGPDGVAQGDAAGGMDRLLSNADELLENLKDLSTRMSRLTSSLTEVADDPKLRRSLVRTVNNFEKASESGVVVARNMERATGRADRLIASFQTTAGSLDRTLRRADTVIASLRGTADESRALMRDTRQVVQETRGVVGETGELVRSTNDVVKNAGGLVTDTRTALAENRERLKDVFDNLNASLKQLDATLAEARSFVGDPTLRADLKATAENVRDATATLKKIGTDVQGITGDPQVQEDLRATISGLRDATEQAAEVFARVRQVLGSGAGTAKSVGQRLSDAEFEVSAVRKVRSNRTRVDFDATIPWSESTFYRLGFFDFGEANKFNVQMGQQLKDNIWARYGVHASTLGVGLDIGKPARPSFSADLFGIDEPRLDIRGNLPIARHLDLTVGLDNVFRRTDPLFGIRYRR
jgi:phospholipid/cholesterol/gamma-HCH transport system substrate-binding protein